MKSTTIHIRMTMATETFAVTITKSRVVGPLKIPAYKALMTTLKLSGTNPLHRAL